MRDALRDGLSTIAEFVPKLALFLVILVIGIIIAKLIAKALNALLERTGFDRAVERGGIKKALSSSKMDASDIVAKLIYYTLLLFVLQLAFGVFGANPISRLIEDVIRFLPSLVVAIIILVVAASIAAAVKGLLENMIGGLSYGRTLANIASAFILFLGVIAALNQVGVATTVTTPVLIAILATVAGVIIVGVGGGLIRPMQQRWEGYLTTAEREAPRMKAQAQSAPSVATRRAAPGRCPGTSATPAPMAALRSTTSTSTRTATGAATTPPRVSTDHPPPSIPIGQCDPPGPRAHLSHKENTHMDTNDHGRFIGQTLYSSDNEKIGKIGQVFLDDDTDRPEFLTVNTGLFGMNESFVPAADADVTDDGVHVPFTKDQVKDAPNVDVDSGHLDQSEERRLYEHYGMTYSERASDSGLPDGGTDRTTGTAGHDRHDRHVHR